MAELKLDPGKTYSLKVTKFTSKNKTITKTGKGLHDLYFVTVEDKSGDSILCEYAAPHGTCADCFTPGVYQFVKCCFVSPRGTPDIEPGEDPALGAGEGKNEEHPASNAYAISMSGKSITFAMGYAKDILLAEIAQQPVNYRVTDDDIARMFGWADQINSALTERVTF